MKRTGRSTVTIATKSRLYPLLKNDILLRRFYALGIGFSLILFYHSNQFIYGSLTRQPASSEVQNGSRMQSNTLGNRASAIPDSRSIFSAKSESLFASVSRALDTGNATSTPPHDNESRHQLEVSNSTKLGQGDTVSSSHAVVHFYNGTRNCAIDTSNIQLLGQGCDGAVYRVTVHCHSSSENMAIKLFTRGNKHVSVAQRERQREALYDTIAYPNYGTGSGITLQITSRPTDASLSKTTDMLDNFVISRGKVKIPRSLIPHLTSLMTQPKRIIEMFQDDGSVIDGAVMSLLADGSSSLHGLCLRPAKVSSNIEGNTSNDSVVVERSKQHRMVRSLIAVYQHMIDRRVADCDVSLTHTMVTREGDIRLIDFERVVFLKQEGRETKSIYNFNSGDMWIQRDQIWQLFALLAVVCNPRSYKSIEVSNNVCHTRGPLSVKQQDPTAIRDFLTRRLEPALRQCGGSGSTSRTLLSSITNNAAFNLQHENNTQMVLDALRDWAVRHLEYS